MTTSLSQEHLKVPSLPSRLSADAICALSSSTLVAPLICLIDKSIIQKTHQQNPIQRIFLQNAKNALRHPFAFLVSTPYLLINLLYFSTYATANFTDTTLSYLRNQPPSKVYHGVAKFTATSTANISICLYKDAKFTKLFGAAADAASKSAKKVVPKTSLGLFAVRDMMTIFASFNIPPVLGPAIGSQSLAQFIAPASVQLLSTPLHLMGLDLFNRPRGTKESPPWGERWRRVGRDWFGASIARMGRVIPAYGVGGVINSSLRKKLMTQLED